MDERFLCRGKRCDNGEWICGVPVTGNRCTLILSSNLADFDEDGCSPEYWWVVDPATVGQCTGLRDKTGKMLFEGDIFKTPSGTVASVYSAGIHGWFYKAEFYGNICGMFGYMADGSGNTDMEIIGNVHDNSELLAKR